jgi:hypothetical protein
MKSLQIHTPKSKTLSSNKINLFTVHSSATQYRRMKHRLVSFPALGRQ